MKQAEFRNRLAQEWSQRKARNSRYSLRAFALLLGTDHSTLSQILKAQRAVPASQLLTWCKKLGINEEEAVAYLIAAAAPDPSAFAQAEHLRHWSAEALSILNEPINWKVFSLCGSEKSRRDTRWIAQRLGASADEVNIVLTRLLRLGLIEMLHSGMWRAGKDHAGDTEKTFRSAALRQVRIKAADFSPKIPNQARQEPDKWPIQSASFKSSPAIQTKPRNSTPLSSAGP